ncbi:MAG: DUF4178 domain-containing protein [Kineosporiaceae bacterium]|jgi:ribosomal protein S27AE
MTTIESGTPSWPVLRRLACPNCGATVSQVTAQAQTLTCGSCHATLSEGPDGVDIDPGAQLPTPRIPIQLGQTLPLDGYPQVVLGRVRYQGWDPADPSDQWAWDEWLVGRPDGRLSWLTHDENGLSLSAKVRQWGPFDVYRGPVIPLGDGRQVPVVERYPARVLGVDGELTSRVRRGDELLLVEGRLGDTRCDVEATANELDCSCGRLLDDDEIEAAFGAEAAERLTPPRPLSLLIAGVVLGSVVIALIMAGASALYGRGRVILAEESAAVTVTTPWTAELDLNHPGRPVQIEFTLLDYLPKNTYSDLDVSIISPDGTDTLISTPDFWHETGIDEGEHWDEEQHVVRSTFVPAQQGRHTLLLELDPEGALPAASVRLQVRDAHLWTTPWLIFAGVAGVIGVIALIRGARSARWLPEDED